MDESDEALEDADHDDHVPHDPQLKVSETRPLLIVNILPFYSRVYS